MPSDRLHRIRCRVTRMLTTIRRRAAAAGLATRSGYSAWWRGARWLADQNPWLDRTRPSRMKFLTEWPVE